MGVGILFKQAGVSYNKTTLKHSVPEHSRKTPVKDDLYLKTPE